MILIDNFTNDVTVLLHRISNAIISAIQMSKSRLIGIQSLVLSHTVNQ